jgi:hypothetical protein
MTANNESSESQVQGRRLTQGTVLVWKKGLQTLKNCARPDGMPTDILNHHLSDTIQMGYCLNVLARLSPHEQRCLLLQPLNSNSNGRTETQKRILTANKACY